MTNPSTTNHSHTEKPLIVLTAAAVEKVKAMIAKENKEGYGLRVGIVTGGCAGLSYDLRLQKNAYDNDLVIEQDGIKMFVNPDALALLKNLEIDYKDTFKESGFSYRNPNSQNSCGCGTSFS